MSDYLSKQRHKERRRVGEIEDNVLRTIERNRDEIVSFLQDMVKIPSVSGSKKEKQIQELIAKRLSAMNLKIDMWEPDSDELRAHDEHGLLDLDYRGRPNLVGISKGTGGGRSLILNGHIDVVPVEPLEKWRKDPWGGEIEDGKMYGRGTADMKGGIAAMIMALHCAKDAGIQLKGDVIIESVVDEERFGNGSLACALKGYKADAGVVTEPTGINICPAHGGFTGFRIKVQGRPTHPCKPAEGVNAIGKATKLYNLLMDFNSIRNATKKHPLYANQKEIGYVSVRRLEGDQENATVEGSARYLPGEERNKIKQEIEEFIMKENELDSWLKMHPPCLEWISTVGMGPSEVPVNHPIVRELQNAYQCAIKKQAKVDGATYGTDARFLNLYARTPTLVFGPGDIAQAHSIDEFTSIDEVIAATKVLALLILGWCEYN
jgi:acetylornithine deacetylase